MICPQCGENRVDKDFLGKEICFKCQYQKKMESDEKKVKTCRICHSPIGLHRWVYCSDKCARKGEKALKKDYWTNFL